MKKTKSDTRYFLWSSSIIICTILAVFVLIFSSCTSSESKPTKSEPVENSTADNNTDSSDETPSSDESVSTEKAATRLGKSDDMGQEYIDKFVFLGDSTTNGLKDYNIIPANQVWTPKSGTLTLCFWDTATINFTENGTEITIKEAVAAKKPEYLLITLGVNGISFMDEESFTQYYTGLVEAVQETSPDTKIILNSIYPVTSNYPESNGITNPKIDAANSWIEGIAEARGVKYLDSANVLKDKNGALTDSYCNGDNIHLNTEGYNQVINYVRTHGWK